MSETNLTTTDLQTQTATHLSAIELGLGSTLHAFKIPFTGHFLSLNQGFFLSYTLRILSASTTQSRFQLAQITFEISILAALLKSLSPAGQKWGPMLSISMQGILYSVGICVFGANIVGAIFGMIFLSVWAFIQPLITLVISFGFSDIQKMFSFYIKRLDQDYQISNQNLWTVLISIFAIKMILASLIALASFHMKSQKIKKIQQKLKIRHLNSDTNSANNVKKSVHQKVFSDITKPLFLLSFTLTYIFLFMTEDNSVLFFWKALRPLAIAILVFYFLRSETCHRLLLKFVSKSEYLKSLHQKSQKVFNQLD